MSSTLTAPGPMDALGDIATWDASEASESRIYEGEGTNMSGRWRARRARRGNDPRYRKGLLEAARLYERVLAGDRYAGLQFQEAMSTSDFSNLFGDILDRQILARYQQMPVQWTSIAKRGRVRDFRQVRRFTLDGAESTLSAVRQLTEYPAAALTDGVYTYSVGKFGRRVALSWEDLVNDDLDAFASIPDRLGNAARRTEERFVTDLYAAAGGPDSTFFSAGNKNLVTAGASSALSITSLQAAYTLLASQVDADGAPIYIESAVLVVPPALKVQAMNILNATEILAASGGGNGGANDQLTVANWMRNDVSLIVNPWLPLITTSGTFGSTAWYLFANPNVGRPAMEVGFLVGHETPELFQKSPNAVRVGGGAVAPEDGDFDTDSVEWKLRHTLGGTLMDPKSAVASPGQ
ncbi:Mu-like prophage major head subunit gpT family protein [Spongiactinospora sp. TRM90649]|uniref:phage major capsid protein n=1 Tax=Spongiactinospora sp. TRM90649 TaxID=3031114 RepID=UPI0023F74F73|nr:Mu-like prophage major head subunit gpT family protein [Spongiactinospora sp. TRM90649]MDF5758606.1 Mu-like prophage major head subunit gpT family protein [Spongiactinospora sp. TRM90649]